MSIQVIKRSANKDVAASRTAAAVTPPDAAQAAPIRGSSVLEKSFIVWIVSTPRPII